jgi:peptidoglycan hydrolase CwlO-like protein
MSDKTIAQQLEDANARIAAHVKQVEADTAAHQIALAKAGETAKTQETRIGELTAAVDAHKAQIATAGTALKTEQDAHAGTKTELATAKRTLALPQFADAGKTGTVGAGAEGGTATDAPLALTPAQAIKAYTAIDGSTIEGARQRQAFADAHAKELGL